ncbi:MAG: TRAP transporter large permease subunit, partial [Desulfobacterales bacterium]|nr:TRAP transporter large permease subunit [Desulfobacterales bacterium]
WDFTLPLIVITIFMLTGYSPAYSAILGLATCVAVSYKAKDTRIDLTVVWIAASLLIGQLLLPWIIKPMMGEAGTAFIEKIFSARLLVLYGLIFSIIIIFYRRSRGADIKGELMNFVEASRAGAENSLKIGATVGVIGIIIGVLTYSGLVLTFADIVIELAGGSLVLTILFIALASLVLGMGVPVTAAYLITAVVAVPALIHLGVNELAAHMIVYWLSQDSNITPPVCIAAFAGATIAKANMWRTAFTAFKFAKFLYLGPFLFGYVPGFSLNGSAWDIVKAFVLIIFGTYAYSWILSGIWFKSLKGMFKKAPAS